MVYGRYGNHVCFINGTCSSLRPLALVTAAASGAGRVVVGLASGQVQSWLLTPADLIPEPDFSLALWSAPQPEEDQVQFSRVHSLSVQKTLGGSATLFVTTDDVAFEHHLHASGTFSSPRRFLCMDQIGSSSRPATICGGRLGFCSSGDTWKGTEKYTMLTSTERKKGIAVVQAGERAVVQFLPTQTFLLFKWAPSCDDVDAHDRLTVRVVHLFTFDDELLDRLSLSYHSVNGEHLVLARNISNRACHVWHFPYPSAKYSFNAGRSNRLLDVDDCFYAKDFLWFIAVQQNGATLVAKMSLAELELEAGNRTFQDIWLGQMSRSYTRSGVGSVAVVSAGHMLRTFGVKIPDPVGLDSQIIAIEPCPDGFCQHPSFLAASGLEVCLWTLTAAEEPRKAACIPAVHPTAIVWYWPCKTCPSLVYYANQAGELFVVSLTIPADLKAPIPWPKLISSDCLPDLQ